MAALMALNAPLLEYVAPAMLSTGLPEATSPPFQPIKPERRIAGDLGADAGGLGGAVDGDTGNGTLGVKGNVDRDVLAGVTGGRSLDGDIAVRGLDSTSTLAVVRPSMAVMLSVVVPSGRTET